MKIIKAIILLISFVGYYLYAKRKLKLREEFIPICIFSSIGVLEFLGGILNFMELMTISICGIGVIVFIKELYLIIKNKEKIKINFNIIYFIFFTGLLTYLLKGVRLSHYDNFSHWGTIVKDILVENRLPNFLSSAITFKNYPPGTACFIYYICKFLGEAEWVMLVAQSMLILSSIYTVLAFCNKNKIINYVLAVILTIYMLIGNISIHQLLVDTVLSVMGIAGLAIVIYYKEDSRKALFSVMPVLALLMIVKNSGIFFIIIDVGVWFSYYIHNNGFKKIIKEKYILLLLIPIVLSFLWSCHTKLVFDDADTSKHAMTISNYTNTINEKAEDDIEIIFNGMIEKITDIKDVENIILLWTLLSFIIMFMFSLKNKTLRKFIIKYFILIIVTYILYQISLFGMYLFSMPIYEARYIAAYSRYNKTLVMFEYGILTIVLMNFINESKFNGKAKNIIINIIIDIIFLILIIKPVNYYKDEIKPLYQKGTPYIMPFRDKIQEIKLQNNIEENKSYLIYFPREGEIEVDYFEYVCRYDFRGGNVRIIKNFAELGDMNKVFDYDYFIILRSSDEIVEFINKINGDVNQNVIRFR